MYPDSCVTTWALWIGLICPSHKYQFSKTGASNAGFTHCACRNCLLKHTNEEKIEGRKRVKKKRKRRLRILLDDLKKKRGIPEAGKGSTRSQSVEKSRWKTLWTCRKADYRVNECLIN
jgi:hypothetical protein